MSQHSASTCSAPLTAIAGLAQARRLVDRVTDDGVPEAGLRADVPGDRASG